MNEGEDEGWKVELGWNTWHQGVLGFLGSVN